ncbi:MAG TPA: hypothetical protein VJJ26_04615 [Candidatus Babeliales bacterium]|nr:hypothetical protein [Candidatus Babeliales bacterium]
MKRSSHLLLIMLCTTHTTHTMENPTKQPNTKGIIPLFKESDSNKMAYFNVIHQALVDDIRMNLYERTTSENERIALIQNSQAQLRLIYKECQDLGPRQYLEQLKEHHEIELAEFTVAKEFQILEIDELMADLK